MNKLRSITLLAVILVSLPRLSNGQGCSDAGFCTINSLKPYNSGIFSDLKNQFKIGLTYGNADHSITIFGSYLEYNRRINDKWGIDAKITTLFQNGNGISVFGLSDIYLNASYKPGDRMKFIIGTKIPLTDGNRIKDNLSLPMDYQSSLGTFDLIAGVGFEIYNIQFMAALQQPLIQNKNEFNAESYPSDSKLSTFQSTKEYTRRGDILVRVSYPINLGNKFILTPSILPIYHLGNDKYMDSNSAEKEITGSQGLTLNGNLYFDFIINHRNSIQLNTGMPFVVRDARPDGLTRHFIVNAEYKVKF